jgi:hypothetical protein
LESLCLLSFRLQENGPAGAIRFSLLCYFLNRTPAAQQLRERMNKWDFMKLKSFCTTKEMVSKLK